jgi:hypothetical protein
MVRHQDARGENEKSGDEAEPALLPPRSHGMNPFDVGPVISGMLGD